MRIMILFAALAIPSLAPATSPASSRAAADGTECVRIGAQMADRPRRRAAPRRLDELPPGRLELAVVRQVDGCVIPAVVREGIGR